MSRIYGAGENLTMTEAELGNCRPIHSSGGKVIRALCPFHGGDHQRSLKVDMETGRFNCFQCGCWGYMDWSRERRQQDRGIPPPRTSRSSPPAAKNIPCEISPRPSAPSPRRPSVDLAPILEGYQQALPGSWGEEYLRRRAIPLELAREYGLGYAAPGKWIHKARDWKWGRLVVPHQDPDGHLVNLYGRAVGANEKVPKEKRHDHLAGDKAFFNGSALKRGEGPLYIAEGPFDALSLIAIGCRRAVAIFGTKGWRWEWVKDVHELVFALDADGPGQENWRELAREACLRGKSVWFLPAECYGGHKDPNEALVAGVLTVEPLVVGAPLEGDVEEEVIAIDELAEEEPEQGLIFDPEGEEPEEEWILDEGEV